LTQPLRLEAEAAAGHLPSDTAWLFPEYDFEEIA
jgi:hypothetical protein